MNTFTRTVRRAKAWLEGFAQRRNAMLLLFCVAFVEASFFPISVDVPLIALGVSSPKRSLKFGIIATLGSFLGGYVGYYIGYQLFETLGKPLLSFHGMEAKFASILETYHEHSLLTLIFSGFTPLPYIAFTIAAGFNKTVDLWTLTAGALIGRSLRFIPIGIVLYAFGERAKPLLERSFELITVVFVIFVIAGFVFLRWFT